MACQSIPLSQLPDTCFGNFFTHYQNFKFMAALQVMPSQCFALLLLLFLLHVDASEICESCFLLENFFPQRLHLY